MKTHPKIEAILKRNDLTKEYRNAVEHADHANKLSRSYTVRKKTKSEVLSTLHADLIIHGLEELNGMSADLWLMRAIREYESAPFRISDDGRLVENGPEEQLWKNINCEGRMYQVRWKTLMPNDLWWDGDKINDSLPLNREDHHWKVTHIYGDCNMSQEMRDRIEEFRHEISLWDTSIDPSEAMHDFLKFSRSANLHKEDVRHYFQEFIDMLDDKTDVIFSEDVQEIRGKTVELLRDIDEEIFQRFKA